MSNRHIGVIESMADLDRLIPPSMHRIVAEGGAPLYQVNAPDYDRLPIETFLVVTEWGTDGRKPARLVKIVQPNHPENYAPDKLTKGKRLLYVCWRRDTAVRVLAPPIHDTYRHVVLPCDPRHELVDAFKIACDMRREWSGGAVAHKPNLLLRALGIPERQT